MFGSCSGSGCSLAAGCLAAALAEEGPVCLCEPWDSHFYTALGMEHRFADGGFTAVAVQLSEHRSLQDLSNQLDGINWAVKRDADTAPGGAAAFRLLHSVPGDTVILDCSGVPEDIRWDLAAEADAAVLVCDALPSSLIRSFGLIQRWCMLFPEALILINKMNSGVHSGELKRFLGSHPFEKLNFIPPEVIYKAEYNCRLPYRFLDDEQKDRIRKLARKLQ